MTFFSEPLLQFGYDQQLAYPRDGLFLFGPYGRPEDLPTILYGVIGTCEGVRRLRQWASQLNGYIPIPVPGRRSRKIEPQHVPFPGFGEAFRSHWPVQPIAVIEDPSTEQIERTLRLENRHEAIHDAVDLYVSRLIRENNRLENPPAFWFVVIPEIVYELGRPQSFVSKDERVPGQVGVSPSRARELKVQPAFRGTIGSVP
jgi:hypothetical protein